MNIKKNIIVLLLLGSSGISGNVREDHHNNSPKTENLEELKLKELKESLNDLIAKEGDNLEAKVEALMTKYLEVNKNNIASKLDTDGFDLTAEKLTDQLVLLVKFISLIRNGYDSDEYSDGCRDDGIDLIKYLLGGGNLEDKDIYRFGLVAGSLTESIGLDLIKTIFTNGLDDDITKFLNTLITVFRETLLTNQESIASALMPVGSVGSQQSQSPNYKTAINNMVNTIISSVNEVDNQASVDLDILWNLINFDGPFDALIKSWVLTEETKGLILSEFNKLKDAINKKFKLSLATYKNLIVFMWLIQGSLIELTAQYYINKDEKLSDKLQDYLNDYHSSLKNLDDHIISKYNLNNPKNDKSKDYQNNPYLIYQTGHGTNGLTMTDDFFDSEFIKVNLPLITKTMNFDVVDFNLNLVIASDKFMLISQDHQLIKFKVTNLLTKEIIELLSSYLEMPIITYNQTFKPYKSYLETAVKQFSKQYVEQLPKLLKILDYRNSNNK